ncbi:MAG: YaaR family protein [Spirochaetales bacterium]|nr:YaaR family protein [Spirochaetales bacterium]
MEIDKQNLIIGQNANLFQKDEVKRNKPAKNSVNNNRLKSIFSSMLSEATEAEAETAEASNIGWTDNYMEDNVKKELDEIGLIGRRIKLTQSYDDVLEYKARIQSYLRNAVERSERLSSRVSGSRFRGTMTERHRIEIINEELNELTKAFMQTQVSVIKIAASIDKIQGLLINLEL